MAAACMPPDGVVRLCAEAPHLFMQPAEAWGGLTQQEQLQRAHDREAAEESPGWQSLQRGEVIQAASVPGAAVWTTTRPTAEASNTAREQVTL